MPYESGEKNTNNNNNDIKKKNRPRYILYAVVLFIITYIYNM